MSLFTIIGCGDSAKDWTAYGHTLGVNDCWKWGKPTESLVVCNRPTEFHRDRQGNLCDRLRTIEMSDPMNFYTHKSNWAYAFPGWKKIGLAPWYGTLHREQIYSSNTISFIALSLAFHLGASEIVMFGVDFKNHWLFNESNPETKREVDRHLLLISEMEKQGCRVYLGATGTAFDDYLPVYQPAKVES